MGLINEEKKKKFYENQRLKAKGISLASDSIDFAETELQNLAIDFAEWAYISTFKSVGKSGFYLKNDKDDNLYSYSELLTKFIEQRKIK